MFLLFYNLYIAMFRGTWYNYDINDVTNALKPQLNAVATLITSIFGDGTYTTLGDDMTLLNVLGFVSFILALITSIGIAVVAIKGIKKLFTVFFYGVR